MECIINDSKSINNVSIFNSNESFQRELAQGHFSAFINEKHRELNLYLKAYNEISDKDSFKAEYIATLIYLIRSEIKELQNLI